VQDRTEWKRVKAHLAEAHASLEAGEPDRALEAVDRALAIDPNYLAANALRQRITTAEWTPVPSSPVPAARSSTNLAGLEERARKRRIEHRAQTARTAISEGQWGEARAALDELQDLDPDLPELPALVAEYTRADRTAHGIPASTPWFVATALILAGAVFALSWTATKAVHPRGPRADVATLGSNEYTLGDVRLVEPAPPSTLEASSEVALDAEAIAPTSTPLQSPTAAPTSTFVQPAATTFVPSSPPQLPGPVSTGVVAPLPAPLVSPQAVAAPVRNAAAGAPAFPPTAPVMPAPAIAPPVRDDESLIRETLQRYRSAYEELNAQAARDVWPEVDEPALERAFEALESQRLSFDECSVEVHGTVATAACSGTARYTPRIGSREPRTEARIWNFTLRRAAEAWQIDAARVGR
jgi:tetratricopeptide (TPR) repeat protein